MEKNLLSVREYVPQAFCVDSVVSFKYFIEYIEKKVSEQNNLKASIYTLILDKFREHPELRGDIPLAKIGQYQEILDLVASCVIPLVDNEKESLWAFGAAFSNDIFFGSDAFYKSFEKNIMEVAKESMIDREEKIKQYEELQYRFILEKLFGFDAIQTTEWIQPVIDAATGLYRYYRINFDMRFVDIKLKGDLSKFDINSIQACGRVEDALNKIDKKMPLDLFEGKGFTIITLTDVTEQQALEQLGKVVVSANQKNPEVSFQHVSRLLKTILGNNDIQFGVLPFPHINNKPVIMLEVYPFSIIARASMQAALPQEVINPFIKNYLKDPRMMTFLQGEKNEFPAEIQQAFAHSKINSYVLFPIINNNQVMGIIEICKYVDKTPINIADLGKLKSAVAPITQLMNLMHHKFEERINTVMRDKFTNIQPSVQWRFREAAWQYLRNNFLQQKADAEIEKVHFDNLYPLYGAIDIRNSSIARNQATHDDMQLQLTLLKGVLDSINNEEYAEKIQDVSDTTANWLQLLAGIISTDQEIRLHEFLEDDAHMLLHKLSDSSTDNAKKVQDYRNAINEKSGAAFSHRRELEASMQLINSTLNNYLDTAKEQLQKIYPFYFERFRTDGIEYDIYLGQSLAPSIPFKQKYLQQFHAWQIQSMADMVRLVDGLLPEMAVPSYTTQLIFVHPQTIDISFRNDERRFDVEGTYNIRYHVVKKRIDKVHLLNSEERLTQPGKIALVYFNQKDVEEYISIIQKLQDQGILLNDLEFLDLEELQGVTGLKALRVGVIDYPKL